MQNYIQAAVLVMMFLSGCASLKHPVAIDWEHGAKRGTITQVFDATTPAENLPACLARFSGDQLAAHRYVELAYPHRRHHFREVGELPADVNATVGDQVEVYPKDCDAGVLSTILRRLPPP
ncbi:MAG: hypothetical protein H7327_09525 [Herminiimonas sp.]|nr:hypothetical protein [Herminiimonas sp.]